MKLILVPTPIGNLKDITLRAIEVLKGVDGIIAEDTRVTGKLLKHLEISKPMTSFHTNNEHARVQELAERIATGETMALVSDAGTPAISDPGFLLVRACKVAGIPVETLPGPTAFVPALVNSGFPCDRFVFEGFLPHKKGRQSRLEALKEEPRTIIFYESPHRILKTLAQFAVFFGDDREVSVSRELTKLHEENVTGTLHQVRQHFENGTVKGEFVIVLKGKDK